MLKVIRDAKRESLLSRHCERSEAIPKEPSPGTSYHPLPKVEGNNNVTVNSQLTIHNSLRKCVAFTLAEVLITLAIIGVVAALTIPTLVSNYQKSQYVNGLKKAHSTLINGFKLMAASEGVEYFKQTQLANDFVKNDNVLTASIIEKDLGKYFKITDVCVGENKNDCPMYKVQYKALNGEDFSEELMGAPYFQIQDGTTFFIWGNATGQEVDMFVAFDINGAKGPNVFGRDLFYHYVITDYKFLDYEAGNITSAPMNIGPYLNLLGIKYSDSKDMDSSEACGVIGSSDISNAQGLLCAERIIEEGWQMNY